MQHPKALLTVVSLTAGGGICLYTFTMYMQKVFVNAAGLTIDAANNAMLAAMLVSMRERPCVSDRSVIPLAG